MTSEGATEVEPMALQWNWQCDNAWYDELDQI